MPLQIGTWTPAPVPVFCDGSYNFCDSTTKPGTVYLYFVTAQIADPQNPNTPKKSGASNIVAISR